eukprot:750119-Hanusia_phi.AAC.5
MKLFKRIAKAATKSKKENEDIVAPLAQPASQHNVAVIAKPLPQTVIKSDNPASEKTEVQESSVQQRASVQQPDKLAVVHEDTSPSRQAMLPSTQTEGSALTDEYEMLKKTNAELKQKNKFLINLVIRIIFLDMSLIVLQLAVSELDEERLRNELEKLQGREDCRLVTLLDGASLM